MTHYWGPSRLNHGTRQCRRCNLTYEEAIYALGMVCKGAGASEESQKLPAGWQVIEGAK